MEMERSKGFHRFLDYTLLAFSIIMTFITALTFSLHMCIDSDIFYFNNSAMIYIIVLFLYTAIRQIGKRQYPEITKPRKNELFVIYWLTMSVASLILVMTTYPDKREALENLIKMTGVIAGLFMSNEIIRRTLELWLDGGVKGKK